MVTGMRLRGGSDMSLRLSESLDDLLPWFLGEHARRTGSSLMPAAFKRILSSARDLGTTA
jgi:hypothetical protein